MIDELDAKLEEIEEMYPDDYEDREDWNALMCENNLHVDWQCHDSQV